MSSEDNSATQDIKKRVSTGTLLAVLSLFAAQICAGFPALAVTPLDNISVYYFIYSIGYPVLNLLFIYLIAHYIVKTEMKRIYINSVNINFVWVLAAFILPTLFLLYCRFYLRANLYISPDFTSHLPLSISLFMNGLATGIAEECTFRGAMLGFLDQVYSRKVSGLTSVFVFSLIHGLNFFATADTLRIWLQILSALAFGGVCLIITLRTKCVWNAVIFHGMWNAFNSLLGDARDSNPAAVIIISSSGLEKTTLDISVSVFVILINVALIGVILAYGYFHRNRRNKSRRH